MEKLIKIINDKLNEKDKIIIGIDGKCCSGKTTLANYLKNNLDCTVFHIDDYFIPLNLDKSKFEYNFDYFSFKNEILDNLNKSEIEFYKFNCSTQSFEKVKTNVKNIIIIEGSYSLNKYFFECYDIKIYLNICDDIQLSRLKKRNPNLLDKFVNIWIPQENNYYNNELSLKNNIDIIDSTKKKLV